MLTTFSQVKLEEKPSSTWWENPRECFNTKGQAWLLCQNYCFIYQTEIGTAIISNPTTFQLKFLSALQLTHLLFCINLFQPNHVTPSISLETNLSSERIEVLLWHDWLKDLQNCTVLKRQPEEPGSSNKSPQTWRNSFSTTAARGPDLPLPTDGVG